MFIGLASNVEEIVSSSILNKHNHTTYIQYIIHNGFTNVSESIENK